MPGQVITQRVAKSLLVANLGIVVALFVGQGGLAALNTPGGVLMVSGRITALLGTDLLLIQLLFMGRTPMFDRLFGMPTLTRWHRTIGYLSFTLIVLHVVLITFAYGVMTKSNIVSQFTSLTLTYRDMLMAVVSFGLLVLIVVTSIRSARQRMRHETWQFVHFYAYAAIALAVPHQIYNGDDFVHHPVTQIYWGLLYVATFGSVLTWRFGKPAFEYFRQQLRVADVVQENDDTISIFISGRHVSKMHALPGQYFIWRFLTTGQWWQAHPYSLSAAPRSNRLRITVRALGDGSAALSDVPIGTRVVAEGPYGNFTAEQRTRQKVLFVAGGVGITPIRAMFESIPAQAGDITLIYRASTQDDLLFFEELQAIAERRKARLQMVIGPREEFPRNRKPLSRRHLTAVVSDIHDHDVYICGSGGMTKQVVRSLQGLGVDKGRIHLEMFGT